MIHDGRVIINRFVGNCGNLIGIIELRSLNQPFKPRVHLLNRVLTTVIALGRFPLHQDEVLGSSPTGCRSSGDIDPLSSSDFVVVYSSMALFQIEPELDSTGGLDVAMLAQGADEFITGSSATVFA